jgi:CRISPR-associated protein Cas4
MHLAAGDIAPASYHEAPQVRGNELHAAVDKRRYSNRKEILQGMSIYSEELQIQGKLDTFDTKTGELIERKSHLATMYPGYYMQLYAEYFCLVEMGYKPKRLAFYSMKDNKKYPAKPPGEPEKQQLRDVVQQMQTYTPKMLMAHHCPNCDTNIYSPLTW